MLGDVIRGSWEGAESGTGMGRWLEGGRELWDRPQLCRHYEYLYDELMKYIEEHPELRCPIPLSLFPTLILGSNPL